VITTRCHTIRSRIRLDDHVQTDTLIGSPRATLSQRLFPWQPATSADPRPLLRNEAAIGKGMSNVKIPMTKEQGSMFKASHRRRLPKSKIKNPNSSRPRRATSSYETSRIPKYFPNYFKTVQISRVSLELVNL
jgi:hypothetical protein